MLSMFLGMVLTTLLFNAVAVNSYMEVSWQWHLVTGGFAFGMVVARAQATAATTAAVLTITVLGALHLRSVHPVARLSLSAGGQSFWDSESNLWRRAKVRAPVRSIAAAGVAIGDQHPAAPEHAAPRPRHRRRPRRQAVARRRRARQGRQRFRLRYQPLRH